MSMETIHEQCEQSTSLNARKRSSYKEGNSFCRKSFCSRCKSLGSSQTCILRAGTQELELHKCPLVMRSAYLVRVFKNSSIFTLPLDFPGGVECFKRVVSFCYGTSLSLNPSNMASLRCAAEYLEMNEECGIPGNLCERTEVCLKQVALRNNWSDIILVLLSCESLLPLAEELNIVGRCVESLASIVHHELQANNSGSRLYRLQNESSWFKDLIHLPFILFGRIIISCRKQGVSEKSVSQLLVRYVEKWLFAESEEEEERQEDPSEEELLEMLECIISLLPFEREVVPINFLFALLRYAIAVDASSNCKIELEMRIASQLDLATIEDLLMPFKSARDSPTLSSELESMMRIVARAVENEDKNLCWEDLVNIGKVWDEYLNEVGYSETISAIKFAELVDAVPSVIRTSHNQLYRAIDIFLKAHPSISTNEKSAVCRSLECEKLSDEACIHAVQNELLPLRTVVQAMFLQHLHKRSAFNNTHHHQQRNNSNHQQNNSICDQELESLPFLTNSKSRTVKLNQQQPQQQQQQEKKTKKKEDEGDDKDLLKADLAATNTKLEILEKQLLLLRQTLQSPTDHHHNFTSSTSTSTPSSTSDKKKSSLKKRVTRALQMMGLCKDTEFINHPQSQHHQRLINSNTNHISNLSAIPNNTKTQHHVRRNSIS